MLAGTATAAGLVAVVLAAGWYALGVVFVCCAVLVALVVFATSADDGVGPAQAVLIGATVSLCGVVVLGLALVPSRGGWALAALVAVTSPYATEWFVKQLSRRRHSACLDTVEEALEHAAVDAAFQRIVAGLGEDASNDGLDDG